MDHNIIFPPPAPAFGHSFGAATALALGPASVPSASAPQPNSVLPLPVNNYISPPV